MVMMGGGVALDKAVLLCCPLLAEQHVARNALAWERLLLVAQGWLLPSLPWVGGHVRAAWWVHVVAVLFAREKRYADVQQLSRGGGGERGMHVGARGVGGVGGEDCVGGGGGGADGGGVGSRSNDEREG